MDELTAAVLANALVLAAEEASIVVVRAAFSTFIVEGSDASAAVLDARGRLVAQSAATSLAHANSLTACMASVLEDHPLDTIARDDVIVMNDAYRGGIHANDLAVFQPVFVADRPAYFTATLIHVGDLGGSSAGGMHATATDIFQEGLQLPPVRLTPEVEQILKLNSRRPAEMWGDVQALVAGTIVARRRMETLIAEHGADIVAQGVDAHLDRADALVRRELAQLTPGTYQGSYPLDDGPVVRVTVTVDGDRVVVDFEGTDEAVAASINSSLSQTTSGALFALRCFVDAPVPINDGTFRAFDVRVPLGSLLNPKPPLPLGGRYMAVDAVIDAVWAALSQARPDKAIAASGILTPYAVASVEAAPTPWLHMSFDYGGVGARQGHDGTDGQAPHFGLGRSMIAQVEPVEARCPLRVESLEVIEDSGGAGRWRGGRGIRTTFRALEDSVATFRCDRHAIPPPGRDGGAPGRGGGYFVNGQRLPDKAANVRLRAGDRFVVETSGGGGFGKEDQ